MIHAGVYEASCTGSEENTRGVTKLRDAGDRAKLVRSLDSRLRLGIFILRTRFTRT